MISVCMATYNGARFIKQQIDSILPQLCEDDELIISDDGSSDGTLDIIASYGDSRIKLFHHMKSEIYSRYKQFRYATENFENALNHAKGNYIFLSDQDDVWFPYKVVHCLELLKTYDCVVHNYEIIDENTQIQRKQYFKYKPIHKSIFLNVVDNHFRGCCMAFKSNLLKIALPIPHKVVGHDYWFGTLAAYYGKTFYEIKPQIQSRWYSESVSSKKKTSLYYKIKYRLDLLCEIVNRIMYLKHITGENV